MLLRSCTEGKGLIDDLFCKTDIICARCLHKNEGIKTRSNYLRGTILEGIADSSNGSIAADDQQLSKFHGLYQQDDRDVRAKRRKHKLDKAYSFLARICLPGGVCPEQWQVMDKLANFCAFNTLKITTRQAIQLHGILKGNQRGDQLL